ncbi:MAG: PAS domain S-box protein [Candidatus Cloacimonetes bacterium]|nr:PAS domain S-box protein [Candidatus Cloacimonadota bacterium]
MSAENELFVLLEKLKKNTNNPENQVLIEVLKNKISYLFVKQKISDNILNQEDMITCVIDLNQKVVFFNNAAESLTGLQQINVVGKEIDNDFLISEKFYSQVLNDIEQDKILDYYELIYKTPLADELCLKVKINKLLDIEDNFYAIQFIMYLMAKDKDFKNDYEKQNLRYLELLDNSENMYFLKDEKLRYTYMSPDYLNYNNLKIEDILGKTDQEVFNSQVAKIYMESDFRVLTSKQEILIEGFKNKKQVFNVKKVPVFMNDSIIGIAGIISNITHNASIKERLELLGNAIEEIKEGIVITDSNAKIIYVNKGYTSICGYTKEELLGRNPSILKSNKMSSEFYNLMWSNIKQGLVWHNVFINKKKNGDIYEEDVIITPLKDSFNNITHYIAIKKDVTEENIHNRQIQHSAKLESLGTLAGGIAHDFNNILSIILGYAELLKDELKENSLIINDLNEIIKASNRAKEIIRQILLFSRQKESEKSILCVQDVIAGIDKTIRTAVPMNLKFLIYCKSNSYVFMESSHILQIILNLVSNSVQAIKDTTGFISLKIIDTLRQNQTFEIKNKMHYDKYVCIKVVDNGVGISDVDIDKIFDPYFTTKDIGENTGLGLSVIDGIVRSVDGFIDVASELGKGSEFSVYIPTVKPEKKQEDVKESILTFPKKMSVLLIDDEKSIVYAITKILSKYGFLVYGFQYAKDALDYYYKNRDSIDLVITDYLIPVKDGVEIIKDIREVNNNVPCIIISGNLKMMFDNHPDIPKNNIIYLDKPFDSLTLLKSIKNIIDKNQ